MAGTLLTELSYKKLCDENEHRLLAFAFIHVRDRETARDIVQESFGVLWNNRNNTEIKNIKGYLFTIVRNISLDYRKSRNVERAIHENILKKESRLADIYTKTIESSDPNELLCSEITGIYEAEIRRMPPLMREIYRAKKIEGKSYKEIAADLGINSKKVDKELQNAMNRLKHALRDYLPVLILTVLGM